MYWYFSIETKNVVLFMSRRLGLLTRCLDYQNFYDFDIDAAFGRYWYKDWCDTVTDDSPVHSFIHSFTGIEKIFLIISVGTLTEMA